MNEGTKNNMTENKDKEYAREIEELISTLRKNGLEIGFSDISRASKERRNSNCAD